MRKKLERVLRNILGDGVSINVVGIGEYVSCSFRFLDDHIVVLSMDKTGNVEADAVKIIEHLAYYLDKAGRSLLFVGGEETICFDMPSRCISYEYATYKDLVESVPVYIVSGKLYDLRDMKVYGDNSVKTIEELVRKYRNYVLVEHYLHSMGYDSRPQYTLWHSDGLFETRKALYVYRMIGSVSEYAIIVDEGKVYKTIAINGVVAETALDKDSPRAVASEFVKIFNKWLQDSCTIWLQEMEKHNMNKMIRAESGLLLSDLYRGIVELGVEPPEILKYMAKLEYVEYRCAMGGIAFIKHGVCGMYDNVVSALMHGIGRIVKISPDNIIIYVYGTGYSGKQAYEYLEEDKILVEFLSESSKIIIGNDIHIHGKKKLIVAEFLKKFGRPDEINVIITPMGEYVVFKSKTGFALAITK